MERKAKQKLYEINDPEINKHGVSVFTIWQYKFLIYSMYTFFLLSFVNVWTTIFMGVFEMTKQDGCNDTARYIDSWVLSVIY